VLHAAPIQSAPLRRVPPHRGDSVQLAPSQFTAARPASRLNPAHGISYVLVLKENHLLLHQGVPILSTACRPPGSSRVTTTFVHTEEALRAHRGGPKVDGERIGVASVSQSREFLANLCSDGMVVAHRCIWATSLATFVTTSAARRVMWPKITR
jgi:hypothetical protein